MSPRIALSGAVHDRLFFAQVREDPCVELTALRPGPDDEVVVVSSGGCTALSLLAAGAGRVVADAMARYTAADALVYAEMTTELGWREAA